MASNRTFKLSREMREFKPLRIFYRARPPEQRDRMGVLTTTLFNYINC